MLRFTRTVSDQVMLNSPELAANSCPKQAHTGLTILSDLTCQTLMEPNYRLFSNR